MYDFIISTVPIHKELSIPYINISQIINQDDLDKIDNYLSYLFSKNKIETIFHPKLFKANVKARSKTEVVNVFYKMLKQQYPTLKESFKNTLLMKEQRTLLTYNNKIGIIKLNKPLNNNNILAVLILNNPITWEKQELQVIILFSCLDTNNYIYNTLTNTLKNYAIKETSVESLVKHANYAYFLKTMIKHQ